MIRKNLARAPQPNSEQGQSLAELAIGTIFLMFLVLGIYEMGLAFMTFVTTINAAREGAVYAAFHPELVDSSKTPNDGSCDDDNFYCGVWSTYSNRVLGEFNATAMNPNLVTISRPVAPTLGANCPITVTVQYNLTTFSSNITLPLIGRPGLPDHYTIRYSVAMPLRSADAIGCQ